MSEKEKQTLEKLTSAIQQMSELKKQYMLGFAEGVASMVEKAMEDQEEADERESN